MTLLYLVAAWVAGIFAAPSDGVRVWLTVAGLSFFLAYLNKQNRRWRLALVCAALFMLGAARHAWAVRPLPDNHIAHDVDSGYVTLTGIITRDVDTRDQHVNLTLQVESIRRDHEETPAQGLVLLQADRYGEYAYGDQMSASGTLLTPPEFDDFSYRDYLARRGIHAYMPNAQVTILSHDHGRPWYRVTYSLRTHARRVIQRLLPSPQAPLLSGILLGIETDIPDDIREAFNRTGTSHIIAISGANIVIVLRVLIGLLTPSLGQRRAGWTALIGVTAYTLFVGADPAVVRAAIMGGLAILAAQWGRRAHGLTSLAFAIWLMTAWNPLTLWDISFQLSVAATAGLILLGDTLTRWFEKLLRRGFAETTAQQITRWLAEPLVIGIAAQITTTPLILVYFGRLSVIALLANILIVPVQAYIMILGWLAMLAGLIWTPLGEPLAWVVWLPLTYTLGIVRALARFDWASMTVPLSSAQAWIAYSVLLGVAVLSLQYRDDRAALFNRIRQHVSLYAVAIAGIIITGLVWITALSQPDGKLHIWFLDVGQGHAVLLQTPDGAQVLIDGGPNPTRLRRAVGDELPFWDREIDLLIVSQPKSSAINALPALLERYDVNTVLTNGQTTEGDAFNALTRAWKSSAVMPVQAGYEIKTGDGVTLKVLHPQGVPGEAVEPEEAGLVIRVSYGDTSFLLMPDLTPEAEQVIRDAGWYLGSTVLELASRGSDQANGEDFLNEVNPQVAVVGVEAGNRSKLPAPAVLERIDAAHVQHFYRTDHHGTVEMVTDGHTLWVYTDR